jgi:hypothetical protein
MMNDAWNIAGAALRGRPKADRQGNTDDGGRKQCTKAWTFRLRDLLSVSVTPRYARLIIPMKTTS